MLSARDYDALLHLSADGPAVVSLYLDLKDPHGYARQAQALVQDALRKDPLFQSFRPDFDALAAFAAGFEAGPFLGLALFSSKKLSYWLAVPLEERVRNLLRVGAAPFVPPLVNAVEQRQRFGVVLLDPARARWVEVFMGRAAEVPAGSGRAVGGGDAVQRHLAAAASQTAELTRLRRLDRILLGAPEPLHGPFLRHLSARLSENVIVDPGLSVSDGPAQALERVARGERESRKVRESVLSHRLLDAAAQGQGVTGLGETARALQRGQVKTILVREEFARLGRACRHCGAFSLSGKKCAYCWLETEPVLDMVSELVHAALEQGCEVFRLRHDRTLDTHGGIGAELRWPQDTGKAAGRRSESNHRPALS